MHAPEFEQPQLTPQRAVASQAESAETPGGAWSMSALETEAGTAAALTAPVRITDRPGRTAAGGMDLVIRASTAVAVLALAGLAAYIFLLARVRGRPGPRRKRHHRPTGARHHRRSRLCQFDDRLVCGTAPDTGTAAGPLAARPGNRGHRGHEHGPGLVTGSHRSRGRGLASGQPGRLVRTPGLADPHRRNARPSASRTRGQPRQRAPCSGSAAPCLTGRWRAALPECVRRTPPASAVGKIVGRAHGPHSKRGRRPGDNRGTGREQPGGGRLPAERPSRQPAL